MTNQQPQQSESFVTTQKREALLQTRVNELKDEVTRLEKELAEARNQDAPTRELPEQKTLALSGLLKEAGLALEYLLLHHQREALSSPLDRGKWAALIEDIRGAT